MGEVATRRFEAPDETRTLEHGRLDYVHLAGSTAALATFEPGWRWSTDVKPLVGTDSCQPHHVGCCTSGSLHVVADEGSEFEIGVGDIFEILPGHDAWVTSNGTYSAFEFQTTNAEKSS